MNIPSGWSGISIWIDPIDGDPEVMFADVINDVIILQSQSGIFWPEGNINTIENWNLFEGYSIKVANEITLTVEGAVYNTPILSLTSGWNLIPVLSSCEVDVASLFQGLNVVIVKEVAGGKIYWPEFDINTIGSLLPGETYFVLMSDDADVTFPTCAPDASPAKPMIVPDMIE